MSQLAPEMRPGSGAELLDLYEMSGSPADALKPGRNLIATDSSATAEQVYDALIAAGTGESTLGKAKNLFVELGKPITLTTLAHRLRIRVIEPIVSSPFERYFRKFINSIPEWEFIKHACEELYGETDTKDLGSAGDKWASEIERLVRRLRFDPKMKLDNAGELPLADVKPHIEALLAGGTGPAKRLNEKIAWQKYPYEHFSPPKGSFFADEIRRLPTRIAIATHNPTPEEMGFVEKLGLDGKNPDFEKLRGKLYQKGLRADDLPTLTVDAILALFDYTPPPKAKTPAANGEPQYDFEGHLTQGRERQKQASENAAEKAAALVRMEPLANALDAFHAALPWPHESDIDRHVFPPENLESIVTAFCTLGPALKDYWRDALDKKLIAEPEPKAKAFACELYRLGIAGNETELRRALEGFLSLPVFEEGYQADIWKQVGWLWESFFPEGYRLLKMEMRPVKVEPKPTQTAGTPPADTHDKLLSALGELRQFLIDNPEISLENDSRIDRMRELDAQIRHFSESLNLQFPAVDFRSDWGGTTGFCQIPFDHEHVAATQQRMSGDGSGKLIIDYPFLLVWKNSFEEFVAMVNIAKKMRTPAVGPQRALTDPAAAATTANGPPGKPTPPHLRKLREWLKAKYHENLNRLCGHDRCPEAELTPLRLDEMNGFLIAEGLPIELTHDECKALGWIDDMKFDAGESEGSPPIFMQSLNIDFRPGLAYRFVAIFPEVTEQGKPPTEGAQGKPTDPADGATGEAKPTRLPTAVPLNRESASSQTTKETEKRKTENPPPPAPEFEFTLRAGMFCVRGFGEKGYFHADLIGFQQIAMLLKGKGEGVPMLQLVACGEINDNRVAADKKRSLQPVFDDQALQEMGANLKKLNEARAYAEENELTEEYGNLTKQIDDLTKQMTAAMTKTGKPKDLNNVLNKLRPRVFGTLKTAYQKMRETRPPMPKLADHFEHTISSESPCFVYRVPANLGIEWHL